LKAAAGWTAALLGRSSSRHKIATPNRLQHTTSAQEAGTLQGGGGPAQAGRRPSGVASTVRVARGADARDCHARCSHRALAEPLGGGRGGGAPPTRRRAGRRDRVPLPSRRWARPAAGRSAARGGGTCVLLLPRRVAWPALWRLGAAVGEARASHCRRGGWRGPPPSGLPPARGAHWPDDVVPPARARARPRSRGFCTLDSSRTRLARAREALTLTLRWRADLQATRHAGQAVGASASRPPPPPLHSSRAAPSGMAAHASATGCTSAPRGGRPLEPCGATAAELQAVDRPRPRSPRRPPPTSEPRASYAEPSQAP